MFDLIKKIFIGLLAIVAVNFSNFTKCMSLSNQKYKIQPIFINFYINEYSQEFNWYPYTVNLDKCVGSCNTLSGLSNKVCVQNKTEDLNLSMVEWWNNKKFRYEWEKHLLSEKDYILNPATCSCNIKQVLWMIQ